MAWGLKRNHDKRFDFELTRAHKNEDNLASLLLASGSKIELKTEYRYWKKTGNICIEFESYGKPSGILATEAEHWVHSLKDKTTGETFYMIIETKRLRALVQPYIDRGEYMRLGDNNASKCVLLPVRDLIEYVLGGPSEKEIKKSEPPKQAPKRGSESRPNPKVSSKSTTYQKRKTAGPKKP